MLSDIEEDEEEVEEEVQEEILNPGDKFSSCIRRVAETVPHITGRGRRRPQKPEQLWLLEEQIRNLRRMKQWAELKEVRKVHRPLKRRFQAALIRFTHEENRRSTRTRTEVLEVVTEEGGKKISEDVEEWAKEVGRFGTASVQDETCRRETKQVLLECQQSLSAEGAAQIHIPLSLVLQARARLKNGGSRFV